MAEAFATAIPPWPATTTSPSSTLLFLWYLFCHPPLNLSLPKVNPMNFFLEHGRNFVDVEWMKHGGTSMSPATPYPPLPRHHSLSTRIFLWHILCHPSLNPLHTKALIHATFLW